VPGKPPDIADALAATNTVMHGVRDDVKKSHSEIPSSPPVSFLQNNQPKHTRRNLHEPQDVTWQSVRRQMEAMDGNSHFEIGIGTRDPKTGKISRMQNRQWTKGEILKFDPDTKRTPILSYLKAQNAKGNDIYIRLAPTKDDKQQGLILLDDLGVKHLNDLEKAGLKPAVVMETSEMNWQAWIRVSKDALNRDDATQVAKILAKEFGGDPGSASFQHYGRLAGFTNRKPQNATVKGAPYVRLDYEATTGEVAAQGETWVERARQEVAIAKAQQKPSVPLNPTPEQRTTSPDREKERALKTFQSIYNEYAEKYGIKDASASDFAVCKRMAKRGWNQDALTYALRYGSPDLDTRKAGHQDNYCQRTINSVFNHPEVLHAIAVQEEQRQKRSARKAAPARKNPVSSQETPTSPRTTNTSEAHPSVSTMPEEVSVEHPLTEDERQRIAAMKWINDGKERGKPATSSAQPERRQPEEDSPTPQSSSGDGTPSKMPVFWASYYRWEQSLNYTPSSNPVTDPTTINAKGNPATAQPLGDLDAATVAALKAAALSSNNAKTQLRKADWLLANQEQVESQYQRWNPCKQEYLKELARIHRVYGQDIALTPHTDVEIACKLRIAGHSQAQIYKTLTECSPIATSLPSVHHQSIYLEKGINPHLHSARLRQAREDFQHERLRHAQTLSDPAQQSAYRNEKRLEQLGLATSVASNLQQQPPSRSVLKQNQEPER
jgi:RepB DNA-primase from phage plasmid